MLDRRALIGGSMTLAASSLAGVSARANSPPNRGDGSERSMMDMCIAHCLEAHRNCLEAARFAIENRERSVANALITILTDCAEICQGTANSMSRGSPLHMIMCDACAKACRRCEQECLRLSDTLFIRCADSCRTCADDCAHMAAMS